MTPVPCGPCRACCQQQVVLLTPEDLPNLARYDHLELTNKDQTIRVLRNQPNGDCAHLGPDGCLIYEHRPHICRQYDCRKQFLVMTRTQRRAWDNQEIWVAARARLGTLDDEDRADVGAYYERAMAATRGGRG